MEEIPQDIVLSVLNDFVIPLSKLIISAFVAAWPVWLFVHNRLLGELHDAKSLLYHRDNLTKESSLAARYDAYLGRGLNAAAWLFGEGSFGPRSFAVCWSLAFFYPITCYLLSWTIGGSILFGGVELFAESSPWFLRIWLLPSLGLTTFIYFFILTLGISGMRIYPLSLFNIVAVLPITIAIASVGAGLGSFGIVAVIAAVAAGFAFAGVGGVVGRRPPSQGSAEIVVMRVFAAVFMLPILLVVALVVILTGTLVVTGSSIFTEGRTSSLALLLFVAVLPIVNALFDYASWGITRNFGHILHNEFKKESGSFKSVAIGLGLLDFAVAVCLLLALSMTLGFSLTLVNTWVSPEVQISLKALIGDAVAHPLSDGFWVVFVLFSTIVPTSIHIGFVILGLISRVRTPPNLASWISEIDRVLDVEQPEYKVLPKLISNQIATEFTLWRFVAFSSGIVAAAGLSALALWFLSFIFRDSPMVAAAFWGQELAESSVTWVGEYMGK